MVRTWADIAATRVFHSISFAHEAIDVVIVLHVFLVCRNQHLEKNAMSFDPYSRDWRAAAFQMFKGPNNSEPPYHLLEHCKQFWFGNMYVQKSDSIEASAKCIQRFEAF